VATPLALVFDLIARDGASPVFDRTAVAADRAAVATGRLDAATAGISKTMKTAFVGLGIAAIGAEMVKSAVQFQRSMLLIQTQAGASAGEVKKMSTAVLGLSGKVATAPEELAKSLYHVESFGLRGAKALDVVSTAAKGAKVGNADLEETTNALTAAVASNIKGVSNMSQAMGALNTIVGVGDMRLSDLNDALGTGILSKVGNYGLSLKDVGAALATFGDLNIRGADAATQLRMAVEAFAKQGHPGQNALEGIGITVDKLRHDLEEGGLNKAVLDLHDHLDKAGVSSKELGGFLLDAFTKKGAGGVALILHNLDLFESKYPRLEAGAKTFGSAWQATTKTVSYQFDKIKAQVEAFGVSVGTKLLPYVSKAGVWLGTNLPKAAHALGAALKPILQGVGTALVGAFKALVPVVQGAWTAVSGIARFIASHADVFKAFALAATTLFLAFKGYQFIVAAGLAIRTFALEVQTSLGVIGLVAAALGVVAGLFLTAGGNASKSSAQVQTFTDAIKADSGALAANTRQAVVNALEKEGALAAGLKLGISTRMLTDATLGYGPAQKTVNGILAETRTRLEANHTAVSSAHVYIKGAIDDGSKLGDAYKTVSGAVSDTSGELRSAVGAYQRTTSAMKSVALSTTVTAQTAKNLASTYRDQVPAFEAYKRVTIELKDQTTLLKGALAGLAGVLNRAAAAVAYRQGLRDLTQTFKENKNAIEGNSTAALADRAAFIAQAQQIVQNAQAMEKHGASVQKVTGYLRSHIAELKDAAVKAGADKTQVDNLATSLHLVPKDIRSKINVDTTVAMQRVNDLTNALSRIQQASGAGTLTGMAQVARGGAIFGRGSGTSDSIPARLSNGEHVLTASDVEKAGGQGAVYRMRRAIQSGALKFARGGAVSSLMSVIRQAGFSGSAADVMYGIVEAESGGNRFAHNTNSSTGDNSYGLAQINMIGSMGPARRAQFHLASNNALFDPLTNLRVAYSLSSHGRNFSPWTTFTSGAYRQFLSGPENAKVRASGSGSDALDAARSRRSNALSNANSILSGIGQSPSGPQINIGQTGVGLVERQLRAASSRIASIANLKPEDRARFTADLRKLLKEAQRQIDKLALHIKTGDLKDFRKALSGTAADVRDSFRTIVGDLRHLGAGDGLIGRLRRLDDRIAARVVDRNRAAAKLANVIQRDKQLRGSVSGAITGFFDVTQAGTNPVTGQITAGSELAQQKQALVKIRRFSADIKKLENRHLNRAYLRQLMLAGPSALPQVEALLQMSAGQFSQFNRQEREILAAGQQFGDRSGRYFYHDREKALHDQERADEKHIRTLAKELAKELRKGINVTVELDDKKMNRALDQSRKRHNDLHGAST
jgi:TP901 family phage tail tape measure protein